MTALDLARTAYVKAFQSHPLHRLKGKLPEREILAKIGDALSHSQEWIDYQNAWIAENGVKPIFLYEWDVDAETRRKEGMNKLYSTLYRKRQKRREQI